MINPDSEKFKSGIMLIMRRVESTNEPASDKVIEYQAQGQGRVGSDLQSSLPMLHHELNKSKYWHDFSKLGEKSCDMT